MENMNKNTNNKTHKQHKAITNEQKHRNKQHIEQADTQYKENDKFIIGFNWVSNWAHFAQPLSENVVVPQ